MDKVRARLTTWWNGGDIGRPPMMLYAHRAEPLEEIPFVPEPEGWVTDYSTSDFDYRVYQSRVRCIRQHFLGEATPRVAPDLAPNCLALFLGCHGVETQGTVWCEPFIDEPGTEQLAYDPDNFYWDFVLRLTREQLRVGEGKFLLQFPDLIEGLDTLSAMRGNQELLTDLLHRPDWVHHCMRATTDLYFRYYDMLYDLMRDEVGGSHYWCWAPGRMVKLQCDFSAMISADMFGEFMVPVLSEMTERISYSMYHLDGPGATQHVDHLLSVPGLDMIQWTPGAGEPPADDPKWWPMYHRIIDGGEKVYAASCRSLDSLRAMKREFGPKLKQILISADVESVAQAEEMLRVAAE